MSDCNVSQLEPKLWRLYNQVDPTKVCEECWNILFEIFPLSAAALWQRDSDATMYVVRHRGLSSQLSILRLPKMDSAIGQSVMVTGKSLLVPDIQLSVREDYRLTMLSPPERRGLRESGNRTVLILPCQYTDKDYVLMLCFSEVVTPAETTISALSSFGQHFVEAFEQAQVQLRKRALVQLGDLFSLAAQVERETMDKAAELIKQSVHASGVSIFLCSEYSKKLELVGSYPGIEGAPPYEDVYYPLKQGQGLTPEVVLRDEILRYPNLKAEGAKEELAALGYTWKNRWREAVDYNSRTIHAFMAVPLRDQSEILGVIRASLREWEGCYFTAQEEGTLREMANKVAYFVSNVRKAQARTTEAMQHIAHQFISPLNAMQWHCYELRKGGLSKERQRVVTDAIGNLGVLALIYGRNFELIARIWGGAQGNFDFRPIQIAPLLVELARNYQPLAWHNNVNIRVVDGSAEGSVDDLPKILADKMALNQAFAVVIDNAVKYSAQGTNIIIEGATSPGEVHVYVTNVSVIPITAEWCEQIFLRGERTPEARAMEVVGTGTGLWLGRKILQLHRGNLTVQTSERVNEGWKTMFTFTLYLEDTSYWPLLNRIGGTEKLYLGRRKK